MLEASSVESAVTVVVAYRRSTKFLEICHCMIDVNSKLFIRIPRARRTQYFGTLRLQSSASCGMSYVQSKTAACCIDPSFHSPPRATAGVSLSFTLTSWESQTAPGN